MFPVAIVFSIVFGLIFGSPLKEKNKNQYIAILVAAVISALHSYFYTVEHSDPYWADTTAILSVIYSLAFLGGFAFTQLLEFLKKRKHKMKSRKIGMKKSQIVSLLVLLMLPVDAWANPGAEPIMASFFTFVLLIPIAIILEAVAVTIMIRRWLGKEVRLWRCFGLWLAITSATVVVLFPFLFMNGGYWILAGEIGAVCLELLLMTLLFHRYLPDRSRGTRTEHIIRFGVIVLVGNAISFSACYFPSAWIFHAVRAEVIREYGPELYEPIPN